MIGIHVDVDATSQRGYDPRVVAGRKQAGTVVASCWQLHIRRCSETMMRSRHE
ncbi:MAG: hypothetical protein RQ982_09520 [Gammaproteobacteria bacterium]|nr:hypothetical protein [Gammaproteobacteria bacterium]